MKSGSPGRGLNRSSLNNISPATGVSASPNSNSYLSILFPAKSVISSGNSILYLIPLFRDEDSFIPNLRCSGSMACTSIISIAPFIMQSFILPMSSTGSEKLQMMELLSSGKTLMIPLNDTSRLTLATEFTDPGLPPFLDTDADQFPS